VSFALATTHSLAGVRVCFGARVVDEIDATTIAADVRARRRPALAVVEEALDRIEGHRTNAVVTVDADAARAAAQQVDDLLARGDDPGPLAGVPFTVKDTLATAGLRTTAGSLLFAQHVAAGDAMVVDRLRGAGAVLVGKTNCPEFALQPRTDNRVFGPTRHPLRADCSPGGSSGGCAAAVAGGLVPFSVGGDYGGSVRYPATCTGVYGLRPGFGAVPTHGHVPEPDPGSPRARFQTVGPLARTAHDISLVFDVMAGHPARLGTVPPVPRSRIGVVRDGWSCTDDVLGALTATVGYLVRAGFDPVEIDAEVFVEAGEVFDAWRATDGYADLRALASGRETELTPHIAGLLATPPVPADVRIRAAELTRAVTALLATTPVVVLPVARVGVLGLAQTEAEVGGAVESVDALQILAPSRAVSLLGLPALAIPVGLDSRGLPIGVQLVGRPGAEHELAALAGVLASERLVSTPAFGDAPATTVDDHL
jgi:amidase